jgi:cold shock CspA family protein
MAATKTSINSAFCFNPNSNITSDIANRALRKYAEGFESAKTLDGTLPIILDTNILLGYYGMSQNEKSKLIQFINKYKNRIYITNQVEQEYLRNRLPVIKKDFFGPLTKISDDFATIRNEIVTKLQNFRENKKKILSQDYPALWEQLSQMDIEIKAILDDETFYNGILNQVGTTTKNNKNIAYIDELLDLVSTLRITDSLEDPELNFLKELFDSLMMDYNNAKENVKWKYAVPGCGDQKEDASGDFIIFHEMLKFMKDNLTSCIFLTNDVTKGDWLQLDKHPHNHYLEQSFSKTGYIMFVIHAEQTLPNISFENIHKTIRSKESIADQTVQEDQTLESTIITIDTKKGFGFILSEPNLYFYYADFEGEFTELHKEDVVSFTLGRNSDGDPIAKNVKKKIYSFESASHQVQKERIAHINHVRGIGFISSQPENLYFHQTFLTNHEDFANLKVGAEVEFLVGLNAEGGKIARLVRPVI